MGTTTSERPGRGVSRLPLRATFWWPVAASVCLLGFTLRPPRVSLAASEGLSGFSQRQPEAAKPCQVADGLQAAKPRRRQAEHRHPGNPAARLPTCRPAFRPPRQAAAPRVAQPARVAAGVAALPGGR